MIGFLANKRHSRLRQLLSSYIDGEVDAAELREVEEHLADCDSCQRELDTLRFTVGLLQELPEVAVRRSFTLSAAPGPVRTTRSLSWAASLATSVAAMLLVALLLGDITGVLVQAPGLGAEDQAVTVQAAAPLSAAAAEVREVERETVVSEELEAVSPAAAAALPAPAMAAPAPAPLAAPEAPEPALLEADEKFGVEVAVQTESETPSAERRTLAPTGVPQPTPAPPELSKRSAPVDTTATQDSAVTAAAAAPEALTVPLAPELATSEESDSPLPASAPAREAPDEDGLSLPLWQLEAVFGGMAIVLALVALWAALRRRAAQRT